MRLITIDADELQQRIEALPCEVPDSRANSTAVCWGKGHQEAIGAAASLIASIKGVKVQAPNVAGGTLFVMTDERRFMQPAAPAQPLQPAPETEPSEAENAVLLREEIAAIMHNVRELRLQTAEHTGESTGNLAVLERRIEDGILALAGLPVVQGELPIAAPAASGDALNARRYEWLRAGNYPLAFARSVLNDTPHGIDAAIDAQITKEKTE
jgi:hypothetical protein